MNLRAIAFLFLILSMATNLFFGLPRLEKFSGTDEALWSYERIPKFWKSIKNKDWEETDVNDKPGITLALIAGAGMLFLENPREMRKLQFEAKTQEEINRINEIYFKLRLPVYIFSVLSIFLFYFLIKKIFGVTVALFSSVFISLSPILLGVSMILNPDALLWIFVPFSLLSFMIFLKNQNKKFAILSGFFLGLALLTKYVSSILFPFFLFLILSENVFSDQNYDKNKSKKLLTAYFQTMAVSIITIFVFFPVFWVKPLDIFRFIFKNPAFFHFWPFFLVFLTIFSLDVFVFKEFFSKKIFGFFSKHKKKLANFFLGSVIFLISFSFLNVLFDLKIVDFGSFFSNIKEKYFLDFGSYFDYFNNSFLSSSYHLIFSLNPPVVFSLIFILLFYFKKSFFEITEKTKYLVYLSAFVLFYYLGNAASSVASVSRYQIAIYPLSFIIAGLGVAKLIESKKIDFFIPKWKREVLLLLFIISGFFSLLEIRPHFFSYSSRLLPKEYSLSSSDIGDGSYEISEYLNGLFEAQKIFVWSDRKQVCEKFVGKCSSSLKPNKIDQAKFDYFVASARGRAESESFSKSGKIFFPYQKISFEKLYSSRDFFEKKIEIGGNKNNFIKAVSDKEVLSENGAPEKETACYAKDRENVSRSISDCQEKGAEKIIVGSGDWFSGPIRLKSNVELYLEKNARIKFVPDPKLYLPAVFSRFEGVEYYNYSPLIYAYESQNIAITGEGELDGQEKLWRKDDVLREFSANELYRMGKENVPVEKRNFASEKYWLQPSFIQFVNCKDIKIEGIKIKDSPNWTIHPIYSENIVIRDIEIKNSGPNSDGIVPDSSRKITIEDVRISSGDDAIAIKSGVDEDGRRVGKISEDIFIQNSKIEKAHGGLVVGSEMSGGVRNVRADNLEMERVDYGIRLKSTPERGGFVENINLKNIRIDRSVSDAIEINLKYRQAEGSALKNPPTFENILIENLFCRRAKNAITLIGLPESPLQNIQIKNAEINSTKGITSENLKGERFENLKINIKD